MGACYTVACRPCRKTLELSKFGRVFWPHAEAVEGEPAPVLTMNAVMAGITDTEHWPEAFTPTLIRWLHEHAAHAAPLLLSDYDDGPQLVRDDPDPWDETDIDDACRR